MADQHPSSTDSSRKYAERHLQLARQESLRQRIIARDERALVELIDVATPWLMGVAEGVLRDREEAEEVVLESFRRIWNQIHTITDSRIGLMPWLLRVTRNQAIDRHRARKRRVDGEAALAAELAHEMPLTSQPAPDVGAMGMQVHVAVQNAISALSPEQAHAVRLAFFSGLSHSEIAAAIGVPLGTVKGRLRNAFEKLRVSLASVKEWAI